MNPLLGAPIGRDQIPEALEPVYFFRWRRN